MRRPVVAANWKMNKTVPEAAALAGEVLALIGPYARVERVLCPPFVALTTIAPLLAGSGVGLGAQNMHWEKSGAYTGEIAAPMLVGLAQYVILGHSERRQFFGETDETVNKKLQTALAAGLTPIVCVGENLAENEAGQTAAVVVRQMQGAYAGLTAADAARTIVAYEPVWAIGTGRAATPAGANAVIGLHIRGALADLFGAATADALRVQYGGSVTAANAVDLMTQPDIDGALVGGASLKPADFAAIVKAAAEA
ncbi:MAG: triose-phosphate isomerase [Anaerolineales bacterium]|nr:triose-phosphate isomerase [Anaerolineales bacterium]